MKGEGHERLIKHSHRRETECGPGSGGAEISAGRLSRHSPCLPYDGARWSTRSRLPRRRRRKQRQCRCAIAMSQPQAQTKACGACQRYAPEQQVGICSLCLTVELVLLDLAGVADRTQQALDQLPVLVLGVRPEGKRSRALRNQAWGVGHHPDHALAGHELARQDGRTEEHKAGGRGKEGPLLLLLHSSACHGELSVCPYFLEELLGTVEFGTGVRRNEEASQHRSDTHRQKQARGGCNPLEKKLNTFYSLRLSRAYHEIRHRELQY